MIILHHFLLPFWESKENWIDPQNFDTLFEILIGLYLLFTFIPEVVGYMELTKISNTIKIRKFWADMLTEVLARETDKNKNLLMIHLLVF